MTRRSTLKVYSFEANQRPQHPAADPAANPGAVLARLVPKTVTAALAPEAKRAPAAAPSAKAIVAAPGRPNRFLAALAVVTAIGTGAVWQLNEWFAPEMYSKAGPIEMGRALASGKNFTNYDLNINIREMRDAHIDRMTAVPDVVVLGASHWQEANGDLLPHKNYFNAHVHRDYYEDMLGVTEMFVRHGKLPKQMIISIRDNLFTPVSDRKDYLWLPGAPYARAMAERLSIAPLSSWTTLPIQRWREQLSIQMLYNNVARWAMASDLPRETDLRYFNSLDTLLPDGSILWSSEHKRLFTRERAERLSIEFAEQNRNSPPNLDAQGIATIDALLAFLKKNNVEVFLAHPPFNPIYYERIKNTPYSANLRRVEEITRGLAKKYDLYVIGSFDPEPLGCSADMFIDAEHAGPECLQNIFADFVELDTSFRAKDIRVASAPKLVMPTADSTAAALAAALGYGHRGVAPQQPENDAQPNAAVPQTISPVLRPISEQDSSRTEHLNSTARPARKPSQSVATMRRGG